ncbi:MAG TPA: TonB-dependent receptor [Rhizomicrobium sp.]|nr:TonB-dependent receptor [Rhizomicrobium sp.]
MIGGAGSLMGPAHAQDQTPSVDAIGIETVTVTARRRPEDQERVPVAITPISGEMLRTTGTTSAIDLQDLAPSLTVSGNLGSRDTDIFTIRGQTEPFGGADPGVQTYFADVPFNASGHGSLYDLDNIQVLNGPQGTLFGRNTTGGAVLFEPKRPDDQFGGYLDATFGNYSDREIQGAINVPLSDTLWVRAAGDVQYRNGFTKDVSTGQHLDNVDYQAFRVGATWRPVSGFENYLVFDWLHDHNHGTGAELTAIAPQAQLTAFAIGEFQLAGDPNAVADGTAAINAFYPTLQFALANQQALGARKTTSSIPLFYKRDSWGITDIATYDVAAHVHLKNIFAYRRDQEQPAFDYDGSFLPILDIPNPRTWESNSYQVTEEFQVSGENASNTLNWILGFYHELDRPAGYAEVERDVFGGGFAFPPLSSTEIDRLSNGGSSNAVYGQMHIDASDWVQGLSFDAGGRYTWDHKVASSAVCIIPAMGLSCPYPVPETAPYGQPTLKGNFRAPTWTLAVNYQASDDTMLYATYRRGYKSGGFNSGAVGTGLEEFKPEYLTDVELGIKNNWTILGVPGRTNADAYYGWYQDIQKNDLISITDFVPPGPAVTRVGATTINAAKATVKGVEVSATFIPNENIEISPFYSYTDASYDSFVLPTAIFNGAFVGTANHKGNPFAYTPKSKFGITGRFHIPVDPAWGRPYFTVQWYTQSKVWFTDLADEEPDAFQKSYDLLNLRVDWDNVGGSAFDAAVFANNVTNQTYKIGANALEHLTGTTASIYGEPRMYGVELRYRFGEDAQ